MRRRRQAATVEELNTLIDAARRSVRAFRGLAGPDRATLYVVSFATGFRAGALASPTPAQSRLDADSPTVTVAARDDKRRRGKTNPLPRDVAAALRAFLAGRPASLPIWPGTWATRAADMLRADLVAAGMFTRSRNGSFSTSTRPAAIPV